MSLLADIIQPQDVEELCSVLVEFSEAAKTIAGKDWFSFGVTEMNIL